MNNQPLRVLSEVNSHAYGYALSCHIMREGGTYLCLTDSIALAEKLYKQIHYFTHSLQKTQSQTNAKTEVYLFQDREILPYDNVSAPSDLISERLKILEQWQRCQQGILVVAVSTAMHRLPPRQWVNRSQLQITKGQEYGFDNLINYLVSAGYERVTQVAEAGQYSQRGGVIDVFVASADLSMPLRIEFFDDEIEEIRLFDVNSQRSVKSLDKVNLSVADEYTLDKASQAIFTHRFEQYFSGLTYHSIYSSVMLGEKFEGIEYFLPLFHENELETLVDYCPKDTQCVVMPRVKKAAKNFYCECQSLYNSYHQRDDHLCLPVDTLFCTIDDITHTFKQLTHIQNSLSTQANASVEGLVKLPIFVHDNLQFEDKVQRLLQYAQKQQASLIFSFNSALRLEILESYLRSLKLIWQQDVTAVLNASKELKEAKSVAEVMTLVVTITPLDNGFIDKKRNCIFCTESDIYGKVMPQKELKHESASTKAVQNHLDYLDLPNLQLDQLVTHIEHGVGVFKGLHVMEVGGFRHDAVAIEYADGGRLYVPVERLHYIERYVGNNEMVTLDRLGSGAWDKRKEKAKKRIFDVAAELLEVYAKRKQLQRQAFVLNEDYERFVAEFPYIETADQHKACQEVLADLKDNKPMDRLICGDVGFGKTEVAMRSAYAVVTNGKQVAILVPTTLLANQHYQSFSERFVNSAISIAVVSRLNSSKENQQILAKVAEGSIDIIIGTHRLLQKDVRYCQLGLVIVDEEHRFGVRQKESFKKIRTEVDLLSMSATPIPRTLNMAFSHLRDVSIIAEAPAGRLSVHTVVSEYSDSLTNEAILRELRRGGQIYFVHNSVSTIERRRQEILDLLPEVSIGVAHGQMPEKDMERIMEGFYLGQYHILLCTTIIEMGLDVPNANTIIIDRADKFGLAQLHQLRGRVGRSSHQAYAYLFTPEISTLKTDARKRLLAIQEAQQLGAGFRLALEDMEIRGVGEILGDEQQGHAQKIGLNLYLELLDEAIKNQGSENNQSDSQKKKSLKECEVDLNIEAIFPDDYIHDVNIRLSLYQRIGVCDREELEDLWLEVRDRFGKPPPAVKNLFDTHYTRLICRELGIMECKLQYKNIKLTLADDHGLSVDKIIDKLQQNLSTWQLKNNNQLLIDKKWLVKSDSDEEDQVIQFEQIETLLKALV